MVPTQGLSRVFRGSFKGRKDEPQNRRQHLVVLWVSAIELHDQLCKGLWIRGRVGFDGGELVRGEAIAEFAA
jgi:hypothetical protein